MHGHDLFSPEETQTRRQIWWVCVQTDRYVVPLCRALALRDQLNMESDMGPSTWDVQS